jgi:hypothetical protein
VFENESHVRPFEEVYISNASWAYRPAASVVRHSGRDLKDPIACPPDSDAEVRVFAIHIEVFVKEADFLQETPSNQYVPEVIDLKRIVGDVRILPALSNARVVAR